MSERYAPSYVAPWTWVVIDTYNTSGANVADTLSGPDAKEKAVARAHEMNIEEDEVVSEMTTTTTTTTTSYGSWSNHGDHSALTVRDTVITALGEYAEDYRVDDLIDAYRAAINSTLRGDVKLCGDEFIGPYPEPLRAGAWIEEDVASIDLLEIAEAFENDTHCPGCNYLINEQGCNRDQSQGKKDEMTTNTTVDPRAYTTVTHLAYAGSGRSLCGSWDRIPGVVLTSNPDEVECTECLAEAQRAVDDAAARDHAARVSAWTTSYLATCDGEFEHCPGCDYDIDECNEGPDC